MTSEKPNKAKPTNIDYDKLKVHFAYQTVDIIRNTLHQTTPMAKVIVRFPLRIHFKSRFQILRKKRLNEVVATDIYFSSTKSLEGFWCSQVFYGTHSKFINVQSMHTESEFPDAFKDFIRERKIPNIFQRDNARSHNSEEVNEITTDLVITDEFTEPHHPQQNPAEWGAIKMLKSKSQVRFSC